MCTAGQLGVAVCPCSGSISEADYAELVERVVRGLTVDPSSLFEPLEARMRDLASAERFEEAADVRDRAAALARALTRHRRFDSLRRAGRVELEVDGLRVVLAGGRLSDSDGGGLFDAEADADVDAAGDAAAPLARHLVDEVACVAAWLDAEGRSARLISCEGPWASALPALPRYEPGPSGRRR
jgi:DNA polymerase-3 subunit epsilon